MNPKYKSSWITALRSGKFKQGKTKLHDGGKYCALGVLCVVSGVHESEYDQKYYLSDTLKKEFGLESIWARWSIIRRNDEGRSFHDIAKFIEEKL